MLAASFSAYDARYAMHGSIMMEMHGGRHMISTYEYIVSYISQQCITALRHVAHRFCLDCWRGDAVSTALSEKNPVVPKTIADVSASACEFDANSASSPKPIGPTKNARSPAWRVRESTEAFWSSGARSTVIAVSPGVIREFPAPQMTTAATKELKELTTDRHPAPRPMHIADGTTTAFLPNLSATQPPRGAPMKPSALTPLNSIPISPGVAPQIAEACNGSTVSMLA
mmetsp:Transcript_1813/g.3288  ORF Transcript_1813/g.3288 Transcript_1813/m.3288 type:complete len:228 (-) Transcript_1813:180-863(-)